MTGEIEKPYCEFPEDEYELPLPDGRPLVLEIIRMERSRDSNDPKAPCSVGEQIRAGKAHLTALEIQRCYRCNTSFNIIAHAKKKT